MRKLKQYRIAFGESMSELEENVNELIGSGFELYRNLQTLTSPEYAGDSSPRLYIQVMVKFKKKKKKKKEIENEN